jgi:hypothetical protein
MAACQSRVVTNSLVFTFSGLHLLFTRPNRLLSMILIRILAVAAFLALLTGCGRWVPGYIISQDGEVLSNNDTNMRSTTIDNMRSQLDQQLGEFWRTNITIEELPVYESSERDLHSGWIWKKATITITVIGDGKGEAKITNEEITKAVREYMFDKVERPKQNLIVTTTSVVDAERFAPKITVTKPNAPATNEAQHYTTQNGDTYADLSLAFYGTTAHWRVIAAANKSAELKPGMDIIIPPKP